MSIAAVFDGDILYLYLLLEFKTCEVSQSREHELVTVRLRSILFELSRAGNSLWQKRVAVESVVVFSFGDETVFEQVVDRILIVEVVYDAGVYNDVVKVLLTDRAVYLVYKVADKDIQRRNVLYLGRER